MHGHQWGCCHCQTQNAKTAVSNKAAHHPWLDRIRSGPEPSDRPVNMGAAKLRRRCRLSPKTAPTCNSTAADRETLRLTDGGYHALYERFAGEVAWTRVSLTLHRRAAARLSYWPERAVVCGDDHVPPRTCKNRTVFRERLLRKVYDVHRILGNLVLFHCRVCRERSPPSPLLI